MDAMFVLAPIRFAKCFSEKHIQSQLKVSWAQPDQAWCIFFPTNQLPISRRKWRLTVKPELVKCIEIPLSLSSPECRHTAV